MTRIVFALYPGVTQLDFTGPHQVFSRLPTARVECASLTGEAVEADGLVFSGLKTLADIDGCDVLCVPGGYGTTEAIQNPEFLAQVRRLAAGATYVTSVCTGSLILAAAGLLKGRRAACHWAWRDQLALFGAVPDPARVAGKRILLLDDVLTTGATVEACARALKRAGASRVHVLALARVVKASDMLI